MILSVFVLCGAGEALREGFARGKGYPAENRLRAAVLLPFLKELLFDGSTHLAECHRGTPATARKQSWRRIPGQRCAPPTLHHNPII